MQDKPTSGLAIATLITTFFFQPAAYFLAYFGAKEIASGQKSGRGLITASLILLTILPVITITGALAYFGIGLTGVAAGTAVLLVVTLGTYTINKMMKEHYFKKSVVIVYLIIFMLIAPITIASVGYFGILDVSRQLGGQTSTGTNPNNMIPESCIVNPEFSCDAYALTQNDQGAKLTFTLSNNLGSSLELQEATASQGSLSTSCQSDTQTIAAGEQTTYTCTFNQSPEGMESITVEGTYQQLGSAFAKQFSARIKTPVQ